MVAVGEDAGGLVLECIEVMDNRASAEGRAVSEDGFIDDAIHAFAAKALDDALDGALAEIVALAFHREPVDADGRLTQVSILPYRLPQPLDNLLGDKVLARMIRPHDGLDEVLRYVLVVRQELLRVLRQAVAAIAERWIVIKIPDARIERYPGDDIPRA